MSVIGIGIDLIECARVRDVLERHGDRFMERLLTASEIEYVRTYHKEVVPRLAGRFAAKEAILKVLGTGWRGKISWHDMEVLNNRSGRPQVTLTGECARVAEQLGIARVLVSITHTENYAAANAIGLRE